MSHHYCLVSDILSFFPLFSHHNQIFPLNGIQLLFSHYSLVLNFSASFWLYTISNNLDFQIFLNAMKNWCLVSSAIKLFRARRHQQPCVWFNVYQDQMATFQLHTDYIAFLNAPFFIFVCFIVGQRVLSTCNVFEDQGQERIMDTARFRIVKTSPRVRCLT